MKILFDSLPPYIYGDKVAMIAFGEDKEDVNVFVIQHPVISDLCRRQFMEIWDRTIEIPEENSADARKSLVEPKKTKAKHKH